MKKSDHNSQQTLPASNAGFARRNVLNRDAALFWGIIAVFILALTSFTVQAQTPKPIKPEGYGTSANPYEIKQAENLLWMSQNVAFSAGRYFLLKNDIDASATENWETGKGFPPIGNASNKFGGYFYGDGKTISDLKINRPVASHVGLFGYADGAFIDRLRLENPSIQGGSWTGALVGYLNNGQVNGCSVTGGPMISGADYTGALVGAAYKCTFTWCYAVAQVSGQNYVGGLIGMNATETSLSGCYTMGSVMASALYSGGLTGWSGGAVSACYSTAVVRGYDRVGGLIGQNTKAVNACYSVGYVVGTDKYKGGLVGYGSITLNDSYWDVQTSGQLTSAGSHFGFGLTTEKMKNKSSYWGWNFSNFWDIHPQMNRGYPFMRSLVPYQTSTIPPEWEHTISGGRLTMKWAQSSGAWLERSTKLDGGWEKVPESELKLAEEYYSLSVPYLTAPFQRQYYRLGREALIQPADNP